MLDAERFERAQRQASRRQVARPQHARIPRVQRVYAATAGGNQQELARSQNVARPLVALGALGLELLHLRDLVRLRDFQLRLHKITSIVWDCSMRF